MHFFTHNFAVLRNSIIKTCAVHYPNMSVLLQKSALKVTLPCADRSIRLFVARDIKWGTN